MAPIAKNTIESYYKPKPSPIISSSQTLRPSASPNTIFTSMPIRELADGLKSVRVTGRILSVREQGLTKGLPADIQVILEMVIGDETGVLTVIVNYKNDPLTLRLGLLITVCISEIWSVPTVDDNHIMLFTSICPGQSSETSIKILTDEEGGNSTRCRVPHFRNRTQSIRGLTTLKHLIEHGAPTQPFRVIVVVWSLRWMERITNPGGRTHIVYVTVLDKTSSITLTVSDIAASSVTAWTMGRTVLLLSSPDLMTSLHERWLQMGRETLMHVEPEIVEATSLKGYASEQWGKIDYKGETIFDIEKTLTDGQRVLFTLADLDDFAQTPDNPPLIAFMCLTIVGMDLSRLYRRSKLFAGHCPSQFCDRPVTSPTPQATCAETSHSVRLGINPRVIGLLIDETGGIAGGEMNWLEEAWHQLLGHTTPELANCSAEDLRRIEQRLLFMRIVILFGWAKEHEHGRLSVLKVGSI